MYVISISLILQLALVLMEFLTVMNVTTRPPPAHSVATANTDLFMGTIVPVRNRLFFLNYSFLIIDSLV